MADVLSKLAVVITANTAQMTGQLKTANKSLGLMNSTLNTLKASLIGTFGAYQIVNGIRNAISTIAEFEKQMDKVRAITGATGTEFNKLEKNALDLGRSTEYTARQIAALQVEYGRLGFSTKEILASTKATLNLATATGEDLSRSAEIAGSTLRAFQLDATEMGRVTDVMTGALNQSALALDTFADGMKYVAPVAEATNVSIEETSAMLGVLADAGIKGGQAGTSLRRIFTLLDKSGKPLAERMQELADRGITLADANDEVGLYAQTALLVLAKQNDKVKELTQSLSNVNGEAQRTADIMRDNLSGDIDKLTSAIEGLVLQGGALNGFFRGVTQNLTNVVSLLNEEAIPAWEKYLQFVTLPATGVAGWTQLLYTAGEIADKTKEITEYGADAPYPLVESYAGADFFAKELVKKTAEEVELRKAAAAAMEKQLAAREKEFKLIRDTRNAEFEALKEGGLPEGVDFSGAFNPDLFNNPKLGSLLDDNTTAEVAAAAEEYVNAFDRIAEATERDTIAQEENRKALLARGEAYIQVASAASDAIAAGIAGEKTFAQILAGTTASVIDQLEKQALAAIIAKAAFTSINPIAAIVAATAGFAAIKGLFAKISKGGSGGGSSSGGGGSSSRQSTTRNYDRGIYVSGEFKMKGSTAVALVEKGRYQKSRLG